MTTKKAILLDDPDSDTGRFLQWVVEKYEGARVVTLTQEWHCLRPKEDVCVPDEVPLLLDHRDCGFRYVEGVQE